MALPMDREQAIEWLRDLFSADLTKVLLSCLILLSLVLPAAGSTATASSSSRSSPLEIALRGLVLLPGPAPPSAQPRRAGVPRPRRPRHPELPARRTRSGTTPGCCACSGSRACCSCSTTGGRSCARSGSSSPSASAATSSPSWSSPCVILTFTSALLLEYFQAQGVDFNGDGNPANDHSLRGHALVVVSAARERRQHPQGPERHRSASSSRSFSPSRGCSSSASSSASATRSSRSWSPSARSAASALRKHSVICNLGPHSAVLLQELTTYYAKSLRSPRIVTLGPAERRYDYMLEGRLLRIRYRQGQALSRPRPAQGRRRPRHPGDSPRPDRATATRTRRSSRRCSRCAR